MATNWWEIGKPVQDFEPVAQEKKEQNWWEIGKPVEEPTAQPAAAPPAPESTGLRGFGEGVAATFENIIPTIGERFKQFGFGVTSRAVDRLPDSINIPPPGVPIEDIDRAGGVREYYAQVYGISSDEDLRKVKEESQRRTVARVNASQQRVAELTPEDLNLVQRGVRGGVESLAVMAPAVAASIATRSPVPGLAGAGALEGFGSYAEARSEGKDPNAALAYGGVNAAIEVATELIPGKKLLDALKVKDKGELKDVLLKFAAGEFFGEQAATAGQSLNALAAGLDQELANAKTPEEFARIQGERQAVTAISTIVAGGTQAAGIGAINKVREEVARRDIETQVRDLEEVGSEMERQRINEIRTQALEDAQSIAAPQQNEIALDEGQTEPTSEQYGDNYAQKVYDSIGQYIPANAEFKVEQKVVDGVPRFVVTDREGVQYGQILDDQAKADSFALSLNNTTKSRAELLKQLEPLQSSLKDTLKGFGLNDMGLTLSDRIFTRRGEALTSEGLFDPVVRRVFLAVDAIDPQGTLDTNQRREALRGVLRHEVVHALRYLDLWKRSEWKNLESTVSKLKKPGTDKTYLQIAQENYGDQNKVVQVEEGVADLIRDVAGNLSKVAGKPRSLSERAINFFDKAKNAVTGAGFQTYEDIVQRFEQGDIGARQRGRIRTFRATEERQAEQGQLPERVQRLFTNPEERNRFRQEVVQKTQQQIPVTTAPALNSLRLNAVRESRSTIDPVPPKIRVDEQEVPTRDSEGRLIYSGYEGPEVFGIQTRPTQEGLQNFWRWFGGSKVKDNQGRPQLFYHGTAADITEFRPKQAGSVFVTRSPQFAEEFSFYSDNYMVSNFPDFMTDQQVLEALDETLASPNAFAPKLYDEMYDARRQAALDVQNGKSIRPYALKKFKSIAAEGRSSRYLNAIQKRLPSSANLMPVYVKADKPWDYDSKNDVSSVVKRARDNGADITPSMIEEISQGNWQTIEGSEGNAPILDAIRELGYDSMYVEEQGEKNLAVFDPNQIKSAVGNTGDFSPITPSIRESRKFSAKATQQDVAMAQEYLNRTGELPYLSEGQLEPVVPVARQSIKKPYEAKDLAKGRENDPISGLPLNKDGTVTLYFPATNEVARRTIQDKRLRGATPESNRIYLTNESSGPKVMENPGNIDQPMDGANVMIHVDPSLIHFDQEFPDGRKDFFVQLAEGKSYADKMKQTRLFTLDAPRTRALSKDTKLVDIERSVTNSINGYLSLNAADRRARLKQAREVLKREHNVGTLMGENGKLQKTRLGDYGLTYDGKSVASMGLGLASAQRINEQNLSTCPLSAMCEGLCLGETSGQNLLYGGEGQFKSGPRLSQYLKTEALVQHPEDFAVVLYEEIAKFEKWANSEKGLEQVENEAGEKVMQPKQVYQPAIRLNVTSDFRPQTFASIIEAFPNVMFYDYTKLPTRSIAPNHHLTYSSTGASQVVDGEVIVNPGSNWDKMVQRLNEGLNVAMAFTSRKDMPDFIIDEKTGQKFQVWNGDNYDARFLDPKREDGIGMVVGLTNKDKTTKPEDAAKKWKGFFLDYDRARDGDTLIIRDQGKLKLGIVPAARESRPTRAGPTQPGPATDRDNTSAADALNMGEPINSIGVATGPQITDTMPDGTVDISRARLEPLTKRLIRGVEFIQSAPDKLRGGVGLGDVAKRIEDYYDGYAAKLGIVNDIIRDAFNQIPRRNRESALNTFEQYIRARENKRTEEAQQIFASASPEDRQLISAWDQLSRETGRINLSVTTPDGDPMKVWDSKLGAWRPIRAVPQFFPRTLRKEVMEVMKNPDLDPALWDSLLDSLVNSGRAENRQAAEDYLVREWFSDEIKQDYFAGVEKARSEPLPEIFYDYSWDAATRYLRKWARRTSQIENFGQELGQFKKDWFGTNIPKVRDQETQNYLNAIRERIYEIESFDTLTNIANWANSLATATQLGNPISASLNLLGGTITNVQEFGIRQIAKSYLDLVLDWRNVQKEGTTLGILNKDFMNILSDHVEMDADKYFSKEQKVSQALAKFANATLTFGGFNGAENIVRASAMLAARSWLNDSLKAVNTNPNSKRAKKFYTWVNRENLNADALILENGAGPETDKYMRRAVNVPQGSYNIDMTPVFIDTPAGRFLLKYQKFGTQINRFFYRHFLKPFMDEPTPANFLRVAGFLGSAIIGGGAILALREVFGYGDPGPDDEEIKKALEKKDSERAWGLIFSRAWQNISAAGSLGFFANYAQLAKDWQDQLRVKNPLDPPGLASVETVLDIFNRLRDQGKLTARDLDEIAENALSFYRANKRIGLAALDAVGADYREVKRFSAQKEIREVREYGRRYSEEMEIEFKQRTAPGSPIRTPMTPVNKAIADALSQGDAGRARLLFRKALAGLPYKERERVTSSVNAAVRNRQPIQIGGNAPNQQERAEFLRWARQNLPPEKYQLIIRTDRRYRISAQRAGLGFSE